VFVAAFISGGEMEARSGRANHGLLWAALSLAVSGFVVAVLGRCGAWLIAAQVALFVAIGAVRAHLAERE
jgi:hypothetical protein